MYLSIVLLPLIGSAVAGLRGRAIGVVGSQSVTTACLSTAAILSLYAFLEVGLSGSNVGITLAPWIDSGSLAVSWSLLFDPLTVSMLLAVLVVSSLVHLYSVSYMSSDPHVQRFFSYLSLFTGFMVLLVTGDSYLVMFVGIPANVLALLACRRDFPSPPAGYSTVPSTTQKARACPKSESRGSSHAT